MAYEYDPTLALIANPEKVKTGLVKATSAPPPPSPLPRASSQKPTPPPKKEQIQPTRTAYHQREFTGGDSYKNVEQWAPLTGHVPPIQSTQPPRQQHVQPPRPSLQPQIQPRPPQSIPMNHQEERMPPPQVADDWGGLFAYSIKSKQQQQQQPPSSSFGGGGGGRNGSTRHKGQFDSELLFYKQRACELRTMGCTISPEAEEDLTFLTLTVEREERKLARKAYVQGKKSQMKHFSMAAPLLGNFIGLPMDKAAEEFNASLESETVEQYYNAEFERAGPAAVQLVAGGPSTLSLVAILALPALAQVAHSAYEKRKGAHMIDQYCERNSGSLFDRHTSFRDSSPPFQSQQQGQHESASRFSDMRTGIDNGDVIGPGIAFMKAIIPSNNNNNKSKPPPMSGLGNGGSAAHEMALITQNMETWVRELDSPTQQQQHKPQQQSQQQKQTQQLHQQQQQVQSAPNPAPAQSMTASGLQDQHRRRIDELLGDDTDTDDDESQDGEDDSSIVEL